MKATRVLAELLPLALLGLAVWVLHRELHDFHWHDVTRALEALPVSRVALAVLVTALNYALLSLYDTLALTYVGKSLPYPRVAMTSFVAYAFGLSLIHI